MIFFIIFIVILNIAEIYWIIKKDEQTKKISIIIYSFMAILTIIVGIYYYNTRPGGDSLSRIVFNILNIHY